MHRLPLHPLFPPATRSLARPGGPLDEISVRCDATPLNRRGVAPGKVAGGAPVPGTSSMGRLEDNVAAATRAQKGRAGHPLRPNNPGSNHAQRLDKLAQGCTIRT